jgi:hypothetical protein
MRAWMPLLLTTLMAGLFAQQSAATELNVKVAIPQINASEYHRPYVGIWIENPDQSIARNLAVWYSLKAGPEGEGTKWLKDLRQWWRKGGREQQMPLDGISSATRPVGTHTLSYNDSKAPLAAGEYNLVIEAVREKGDRELVRIPFSLPAKKTEIKNASGQLELGALSLEIKP